MERYDENGASGTMQNDDHSASGTMQNDDHRASGTIRYDDHSASGPIRYDDHSAVRERVQSSATNMFEKEKHAREVMAG